MNTELLTADIYIGIAVVIGVFRYKHCITYLKVQPNNLFYIDIFLKTRKVVSEFAKPHNVVIYQTMYLT